MVDAMVDAVVVDTLEWCGGQRLTLPLPPSPPCHFLFVCIFDPDGIWPADMFDPSVFDIRMVMGVLVVVALVAYGTFKLFVRK